MMKTVRLFKPGVVTFAAFRRMVERKRQTGGLVGEYGVPDDDGRWLAIIPDSALKHLQEYGVNGTYWLGRPSLGQL